MDITIIRDIVTRHELNDMAKRQFGDMVKVIVDVEQGMIAIGGELHSDEEAMLLDQRSVQKHLWGNHSLSRASGSGMDRGRFHDYVRP